ncbi:MAG: TolC family protein [Phycisphaerales bacterium]
MDQLEASWQRILAARQRVLLAARTLQAERNQFDVGLRTSTDVLDAATNLADAQSAEVRALADYQIAQTDLAFATGTLLGATKVQWSPVDPRQNPVLATPQGARIDPPDEPSED